MNTKITKQQTINYSNHTKIDHKTLHFLPFLPSRTRTKGFYLQREWGKWELEISAKETLNTYDLMTLLFTTKEYIKNGYTAGYIGEGYNKREIAGITINVKQFLLEKGVLNKRKNRESLKKSFIRLKTIDLMFKSKENGEERYTSYIYEIEVDKEITEIKIYANKKFIEFIINGGVLVNLNRLLIYSEKEQYAILLDLYLQGTKNKTKQNYYTYRQKYSFEEIEKTLKLDLTKLPHDKKVREISHTFEILHQKGNIPIYKYNKAEKAWIKQKINN